jgi:cell wall-associated NlpC family hydrolase/outer membrane murein-binding lipoprotein Lpp
MVRRRGVVTLLAGALTLLLLPAPAGAQSVRDKQREAARIADQIEALHDKADQLNEDYNEALLALEAAKADITKAQTELDRIEQDLGGLRSNMSSFAVRAYVYADQTGGLAGMLSGRSMVDGVAQREGYTALALGVNKDLAGELRAKVQDADYQRAVLRKKAEQQEVAAEVVAQRQEAVEAAEAEARELLSSVQGEIARLVREEEERRRAAAAQAARRAIADAQARQAAAVRATRTSGTRAAAAAVVAAAPVRSTPAAATVQQSSEAPVDRPQRAVPPPSAGASGAVANAMSQLGVPYRFAAASPGVAFDCSGLTSWAWGRAGVSLPRTSRSQAASLPRVSLGDIQPGDLVFYHQPVGHVGMYVGNGMLVHAPNSGDVVKLSPLRTNKVVAIGRPG